MGSILFFFGFVGFEVLKRGWKLLETIGLQVQDLKSHKDMQSQQHAGLEAWNENNFLDALLADAAWLNVFVCI